MDYPKDPGLQRELERISREEGATEHEALVLYYLESLYDAWQAMLEARYSSDEDASSSTATDKETRKAASKASFQAQYAPLINSVFADIHRREHPGSEEEELTTRKLDRSRDPRHELERLNTQISRVEEVVSGEMDPGEDGELRSLLEGYESERQALMNLKAKRDDVRTRLEQEQ